MPLRNRVQPDGEIIAHPARGSFMGNRGILHDAGGRLTQKRWAHKAWVTCALAFRERRRHPLMRPGTYTELFFHDEAVAFAAGHRPCGECRRADYALFRAAAGISGRIAEFDARLHAERALPRIWHQRRHRAAVSELPDGTFVLDTGGRAARLRGDALLPFRPEGYGAPEPRPRGGSITVLTPGLLLDVLRAGYRLQIAETGWAQASWAMDDGASARDGREEDLRAAVMARGAPPPILGSSDHDLDPASDACSGDCQA